MPIENERKYVLRDPEAILDIAIGGSSHLWTPIQQGYLPGDARVRRKNAVISALSGTLISEDFFTYKIATRHGLVEIEKQISQVDFDRLWEIADRKISKKRLVIVADPEDEYWDIDVFLDDAGVPYFAMAECEMTEGQDRPTWFPPQIEPFIIYEVPRERVLEFTNTRLTPEYCASLVLEPQ